MRRKVVSAIALVSLVACKESPVAWSDVSYRAANATPERTSPLVALPDSSGCASTSNSSRIGGEKHMMWWSVRKDSSAVLMYSSTTEGRWNPAIKVDTTDSGRRGCDRPSPGLVVDAMGRIYAAYFLEPSAGAGIFFVHRMDNSGFHDPVSIAYGKRPSAVSVASDGEKVAVAFEEPNAERGQIWVALSGSMGHLFEYRGPVSGASEVARHPLVELRGRKLEVSWLELVQADSSARMRLAKSTGTWNK